MILFTAGSENLAAYTYPQFLSSITLFQSPRLSSLTYTSDVNKIKISRPTNNKGAFMQTTETFGQDKIMATRACTLGPAAVKHLTFRGFISVPSISDPHDDDDDVTLC